jgi:hypothetical protein
MKTFKRLILLCLSINFSFAGQIHGISGELKLHLDNDEVFDKMAYTCLESYPSDCNLTLIYANGKKKKDFYIKQDNYNSLDISTKRIKGTRELELSFQAGKSDGKRQYFEYNEKYDDWFITSSLTYVYINGMWDREDDFTSYDLLQWNLSGNRLLINKKYVSDVDKAFNIFFIDTGDMNGDKKEDVVFVSKNMLYIYVQKENKLTLWSSKNLNLKKDIIDSCEYHLKDVKIQNSVLNVEYFARCDSLGKRAFLNYKFKQRKKKMMLIGAEYFVPPKENCSGNCYSINYLSSKMDIYDCSGCEMGGVKQIGKREEVSLNLKKKIFFENFSIDEWEKVLYENIDPQYKGDLNRDGIEDGIEMYEDDNGDRELVLFLGTKKGSFKKVATNSTVVLRADEDGARGDPFMDVVIKNGYFSVEHYGGTAHRWKIITTFKYSKAKKN